MIAQQVLAGIECPAGYPCLWHYYGTVSYYLYTSKDSAERMRLEKVIADIQKATGWAEYHPTQQAPADPIWADTPHARKIKALVESGRHTL